MDVFERTSFVRRAVIVLAVEAVSHVDERVELHELHEGSRRPIFEATARKIGRVIERSPAMSGIVSVDKTAAHSPFTGVAKPNIAYS